ncbi:hypothetical protein LIER_21250 [Lithospermum erythrorhizon]|uniref:Reverse transcriptase RNase H-like domain-containing protein n=1 Tax=Lithospermum erythrorhizon TaxID=34254 RepID=A0AAV3QPN2_LITER
MQSPRTQKKAQRLTGMITSLTWFISRPRDQSLPFFKAIKREKEEEEKVKRPVYYVNRLMRRAEKRYLLTEKLVYAFIVVAQKLNPYFEAYPVEVVTDQPRQQILENPSRFERIVEWAIELSEFDLRYKPRMRIKGQALADFMVECTHELEDKGPELTNLVEAPKKRVWLLYVDGVSNRGGLGVGQWPSRSDEPSDLQGREKEALRGKGLLGTRAPNSTLVLPDDPERGCWERGSKRKTTHPTARVSYFDEYKRKVATYYNKRVRARQFLVGDLVLRARQASAHGKPGKLESFWEGLYTVRRVVGPVTYELEILEGRQVPRSWNGCHLRKYYM